MKIYYKIRISEESHEISERIHSKSTENSKNGDPLPTITDSGGYEFALITCEPLPGNEENNIWIGDEQNDFGFGNKIMFFVLGIVSLI